MSPSLGVSLPTNLARCFAPNEFAALLPLHGYLAHKKHPPSQDPTVGLYLGSHGGPRGEGAVSYERGTPVTQARVAGEQGVAPLGCAAGVTRS